MSRYSSNGSLRQRWSRVRWTDVEVGSRSPTTLYDGDRRDDIVEEYGPFDFAGSKNAQALRRWRQAALVLNASRRYRYTLDLKKEREKEQRRQMIRAHAQVIRAALLFRLAGEDQIGPGVAPPTPSGDYGIGLEQLASMTRDHNFSGLQQHGGVKGLANMLKTNQETGINGDEGDISKRTIAFGANTYPQKKGWIFLRFLWKASKDLTIVILIMAAIASLALGTKTEGLDEGWYDGAGIALAGILLIVFTAFTDYRQSLRFQNLNEDKRNIQLEVMRGGRMTKTSMFDVVVGDVVHLRVGDQVPADGILITGCLAVDGYRITGESKIIYKDHKAPFLMSGCKVAAGVGTMLVTGVGINTEWGLHMASTSEETGKETPLQLCLNGVATSTGFVEILVPVSILANDVFQRYFNGNTRNLDGTVQFERGQTKFGTAVDGVNDIVTIALLYGLAYSIWKMMEDETLVCRLSACETMGSAMTIYSDKTGTLSKNEKPISPVRDSQLSGLSGYSIEGFSSRCEGTNDILSSIQISEPTTNYDSDDESADAAANLKKDDVCRAKRVRRAGARRTRAKDDVWKQSPAAQLIEPTLLLPGLRNHPSVYIRLGQLPPRHNLAALKVWNQAFTVWSTAADVYKELLREAGFGNFLSILPIKVDLRGYMSAVIERYFPETHTLHLGTFEIGPTPLAWTMITGIRFGGVPLNLPDITLTECAQLLGLRGTKGHFSNGKLKLETLCPRNLDFSEEPAEKDLEWMFRRLIVYLVGSCFFSGTDLTVPVSLVSAVSNIHRINQYDWGAATFSAFLRGMRLKTSKRNGNYSGFYAFLLFWAYEHLPCMRPFSEWDLDTFPRARRWKSEKEDPTLVEFILIRLELEYLKEDEVNFEPYKELLVKEDFQHEVALSMKRIAFKGLESWEMYMGERNLCQFGSITQIPCSPSVLRYCDGLEDPTKAFPLELLQGINAWDLVKDGECDNENWFRTNSLGRIVAAEHIPKQRLVARRVLELWSRVHQDGHNVMPLLAVQTLQNEQAKQGMTY